MGLLNFATAEDGLGDVLVTGTVAQSNTYARTGTYSYRVNGAGSELSNGISLICVNSNAIYFQGAIRLTTLSTNSSLKMWLAWKKGATILGCLSAPTNGDGILAYRGTRTGTQIGSCSGLSITEFVVLEGEIVIDGTNGIFRLRMNGNLVIDFTGNTQPGADTTIDSILFGNQCYSATAYAYWDDLLINDASGSFLNSWPMGIKCHKVTAPVANGNYHAWTPSAGDNYQCIDEMPPTMNDYLTGAAGNKDSYSFGDAPSGLSGIAAVISRYWGQGGGNIKRLCRYGGSDYLSSAFALPGTFGKVDDVMYEKPGGGDWDETVFNACELGMEQQ